jgi:hypothetical protein
MGILEAFHINLVVEVHFLAITVHDLYSRVYLLRLDVEAGKVTR